MAEPLKALTKPSGSMSKDELSRRGLSKPDDATTPITPPARYISSNFSTPGSTYGKEEDAIILELTQRYLLAGLEGESHPQCRYDFKPSNSKRIGDYRQFLPDYTRPKESIERWGERHELWQNDLKNVDLGLLSDRLERAIRDVYNKHLLVDAGNARLVLVLPSLLSHPILSVILQTLFERWTIPSITLLPSSAMALISAGLRSGLVVDIGWEETVVTSIYEYRQVHSRQSTRAVKMLTKNFASYLRGRLTSDCRTDLDTVEMFLKRVSSHCLEDTDVAGVETDEGQDYPTSSTANEITVDWPTNTFTQSVAFPKSELRRNMTETLLGNETEHYPDDEETPLPWLIHKSLLALPADVRGICISRIVFTGEGSEFGGLDSMVHNAFYNLLEKRGWTRIHGQKLSKGRIGLTELSQARTRPADFKHDDVLFAEKDVTEERYLRDKIKHVQPVVHGLVRRADALGPWVGASLLTGLKVKSFVEIQRDRFLSHGLSGASRELDVSVVPQQRTSTLGMRPKAGDRTSWTLSGWA